MHFSNTVMMGLSMVVSGVFSAPNIEFDECFKKELVTYAKYELKEAYAQGECMWRFGMMTKVGHPVALLGNGALGEPAKAFG